MPRLNYRNNSFTTLAESITNTATSFTVADGSALPEAPFRATLLSGLNPVEIIEVGSKSGNTLSGVIRGLEGTAAVSHAGGERVENRFTAQGLQELSIEVKTELPGDPHAGQVILLETE